MSPIVKIEFGLPASATVTFEDGTVYSASGATAAKWKNITEAVVRYERNKLWEIVNFWRYTERMAETPKGNDA